MDTLTALTSADARWHPFAACRAEGPAGYYSQRSARRECATCPAAEPCLWSGLALESLLGYRYGSWGGAGIARRDRIAAGLPPQTNYVAWYLGVVDEWSTHHRFTEPRGHAAA
ncbi:MAG: WhiB family transcriptional regulator [Acidimicrobiales bacterium]